jgi:hypothetical protein
MAYRSRSSGVPQDVPTQAGNRGLEYCFCWSARCRFHVNVSPPEARSLPRPVIVHVAPAASAALRVGCADDLTAPL